MSGWIAPDEWQTIAEEQQKRIDRALEVIKERWDDEERAAESARMIRPNPAIFEELTNILEGN
jgi:hypothetical protein